MTKQNNSKTTNFWFGFSIGGALIGGAIVMFGTKKGRETLRKMLDLTDNIEENIELLEKVVEEKLNKESGSVSNSSSSSNHSTLGNILDKIKILSPNSRLK